MPPLEPIRYHLDESCDFVLARGLRRRGGDVTTSQEVGLLSATDEEQLTYARSEGRTLVTHDGDFAGLHKAGWEHSGILYYHQHKYAIGEILRRLVLYWEVYEPQVPEGKLHYL